MGKRKEKNMIPKHYPKEKIIGKTAILEENIRNHGGEGLTKGSLVTIKSVVRGRGLTIQAETCPVCGQYAYITGVDRSYLTLLDEFIIDPENPKREAQQREISVETPDGTITAKIMPDLEYPGISLEFCGKDGCPGAILEYSPTVCGVQLRVYGKDEPDGDPIHVIRMN